MSDAAFQRSLVTPEGVDLRLRLGTAGARAGALLLDLFIMVAALAIMTFALLLAAWGMKFESVEAVGVIWLLGFFLLRNWYFTFFELRPRAATPGKRALGLRVAARDGGRLKAEAVFARNAMREIELFLPLTFLAVSGAGVNGWIVLAGLAWSGVFLLFPLFNRDRLRVGDLIAGTWVVRTPKQALLRDQADAAAERASDFGFTSVQLDAYGVMELQVLENVLRGKDRETQAAVARRIRTKIDWDGPWTPDAEFLAAYYAALRGRLEQSLLLGRRKKDKHDKG